MYFEPQAAEDASDVVSRALDDFPTSSRCHSCVAIYTLNYNLQHAHIDLQHACHHSQCPPAERHLTPKDAHSNTFT